MATWPNALVQHFDAVVIGGGPAGATSALLLARAGWSVAILEQKAFPRRKICGEYLSATNRPLLAQLGVADALDKLAGPAVRDVGLMVGSHCVEARLPEGSLGSTKWGFAVGREHLDTLLLKQAARAGVTVFQPCTCLDVESVDNQIRVRAVGDIEPEELKFEAPVVIAAHGSWSAGSLSSQPPRRPAQRSDLFGFKAHFEHSNLPSGLMPLLCFPGGYGGLVNSDAGRTTFSCCIRRDRLQQLGRGDHHSVGEAVFKYVVNTTPVLHNILAEEYRQGGWLSTGPIQPGIRPRYQLGVFLVGNAAGEAHPAVAEGISMAIQSAWLLADLLAGQRHQIGSPVVRDAIGRAYSKAWRRSFAPRIRASAAVAHWAMRPKAVAASLPWIQCYPPLLTWGARLSGKATQVVRS